MSLQFIIGGSGSGKTTRLYEDLIRQSLEEPEGRFFAVVPEQFTMQTQKDLVNLHPRHGMMNIDIVSFERLAYRIFEELGVENPAILDDMGKSMVLRRAASGVKKDLTLFSGHLDKNGFIGELKSLLSEFFQYGITEEKLAQMEEEAESPLLARKLSDMHVLYRAFEDFTGDRMIAKEELLGLLCRVIPDSELIRGSVMTLDGFTGFTPVQLKLLELLLGLCRKITVTVTMDPAANPYAPGEESHLFHMSRSTVCRLIDLASAAGTARERDILLPGTPCRRFAESPELARAEQELFRYRKKGKISPPEKESLFFVQTPAPAGEMQFISSEICRLVREEGYRYRDIAVITGDLETYSRMAVRQFEMNGIPCFIDYKKNILANPMVEMIRGVLEVIDTNFSYEAVFRYLKTGLAAEQDECLYRMENYVLALGIRGLKRWSTPWERTCRGFELVNLEQLNECREKVLAPILPLREVFSDRKTTVREKTEALVCFLQEMGTEEKMEKRAEEFAAAGKPELQKEYSQVYALVMDLFDRITALLGEEVTGRREYADILDAGFAEIQVGLIPAVIDRVVVGDITRTRLSHIKVLFFAGVNDGIVPAAAGRGGILTEAERRSLKKQKVELAPTVREEGFLQRFYLYLALTRPSDRLYLSWSAQTADGKAQRPSVLIGQLQKLFPYKKVQVPDEREMSRWSLPAAMGRLLRGLREYRTGEAEEDFMELYQNFLESPEFGKQTEKLTDAAFHIYTDTGIGKAAARDLYGRILFGSVTRMELYASCAYAHYLKYGLGLSERAVYELEASDIGTLFHGAIDLYFRRMKEENRSFRAIGEEERKQLVAECVSQVTENYGNTILQSSARNRYLEKKVHRITDRTIWALTEQLRQGDFEPSGFEVSFSPSDHLASMRFPLSADEAVSLQGRIDRIDLCEDGDLIYLKVIDYKTGKTRFNLTDIYYGLQLQLVVYMEAAMEKVKRENPGRTVVPAGVFYYNIDDPMAERSPDTDDGEIREDLLKQLRMNGLVSRSPAALGHLDRRLGPEGEETADSAVIPVSIKKNEIVERRSQTAEEAQFRVLGQYVNRSIRTMGREILDGKVSIAPYRSGSRTACDYCPYHGVCGFDLKTEGFGFRRFGGLTPDEIWTRMEEAAGEGKTGKEEEGDGCELDSRTEKGH